MVQLEKLFTSKQKMVQQPYKALKNEQNSTDVPQRLQLQTCTYTYMCKCIRKGKKINSKVSIFLISKYIKIHTWIRVKQKLYICWNPRTRETGREGMWDGREVSKRMYACKIGFKISFANRLEIKILYIRAESLSCTHTNMKINW